MYVVSMLSTSCTYSVWVTLSPILMSVSAPASAKTEAGLLASWKASASALVSPVALHHVVGKSPCGQMAPHPPVAKEQGHDRRDEDRDNVLKFRLMK